jgi:D-sedoheptulose 7-phosphate isomerase
VTENLRRSSDTFVEIAEVIVEAFRAEKAVYLFGNGGSAADAQHIAAELSGRYYFDRPSLPAKALTVNTSSLTAIANDYSFGDVFARQLNGMGKEGDVAVGISTSGSSENVVAGIGAANDIGLHTVGFTGQDGGELCERVDLCLNVPSTDTPRIQEGHITAGHVVCEIVESELFGDE